MIKKLKADIDKEIKTFLKDVQKRYKLNKISPLLYNGIKDFLQRDGKRIRPILFVLAYRGYTSRKSISYRKLLRASLSLELLHDFLLIHDDVIDKSELRRGKPALHSMFNIRLSMPRTAEAGPGLGIVAGDVISALAVDALLALDEAPHRKDKALRKFIETTIMTGTGEFLDILNGVKGIDKIPQKNIFLTYAMKTAKYTFEAPMFMGAIMAGAGERELQKLAALGASLGQAFQIIDDLNDVFLSSKETKKQALSDLDEGKKTLLAWKAYRKLGYTEKRVFKRVFEKKVKTRADLKKLKSLIIRSGSPTYCLGILESLLENATSQVDKLRMKKVYKKALSGVVDSLYSKTITLEGNI